MDNINELLNRLAAVLNPAIAATAMLKQKDNPDAQA
jgi:hypothetical protein